MGSGQSSFCLISMLFLLKEIKKHAGTNGKLEHPENLKAMEDRKAGTPRKDGKTERTTDQNIDGVKYSTLRQQAMLTDFAASVTKQFRIRDLFLFALRCPFTLGD
jgi:hypothetical protein